MERKRRLVRHCAKEDASPMDGRSAASRFLLTSTVGPPLNPLRAADAPVKKLVARKVLSGFSRKRDSVTGCRLLPHFLERTLFNFLKPTYVALACAALAVAGAAIQSRAIQVRTQ